MAKWHGYIHSNGELQVKPMFCDIDKSSPFVETYFQCIEAENREMAIKKILEMRSKKD